MRKKNLLFFLTISTVCFVLSTAVYGISFNQQADNAFTPESIHASTGITAEPGLNNEQRQQLMLASIDPDVVSADQRLNLHSILDTASASEALPGEDDWQPYLLSLVSVATPAGIPDEPATMVVLGFGLVFLAGFAKKRIIGKA